MGPLEIASVVIWVMAISFGLIVNYLYVKIAKVLVSWKPYIFATGAAACPAFIWLIAWLTGDYSFWQFYALFSILSVLLFIGPTIWILLMVKKEIYSPSPAPALLLVPALLCFLGVLLLFGSNIQLFLLVLGPALWFLQGGVLYMCYRFYKSVHWFISIFSSIFCGLYILSGALSFYLKEPLLPLLPLIGTATALSQSYGNKWLVDRISYSSKGFHVLLSEDLVALTWFSGFTNQILAKMALEVGEGVSEQLLTEHLPADPILKHCKVVEGKIDVSGVLKKLRSLSSEEGARQTFASFYRLHSKILNAYAAVVSRQNAMKVLDEALIASASHYGVEMYEYGFPLLFSTQVLEPLLHRCGESTLKALQRDLERLGEEDPLLAGIRLEGEKVDLTGFYQELSKLPPRQVLPKVMAAFANWMNSSYPIIRKDFRGSDKVFLDYFTRMIQKHRALVRFGVMGIVPRKLEAPILFRVTSGRGYLVEEPSPQRALEVFKQLAAFGMPALWVSTTYPNELKDHQLRGVEFVWLSAQRVKGAVPPSDLDILRDIITKFAKSHRGGVVLLDGLEFLTVSNGFERTLKFLRDIIETIAITPATLLVPISPNALDERQLALLERNMEVIRP